MQSHFNIIMSLLKITIDRSLFSTPSTRWILYFCPSLDLPQLLRPGDGTAPEEQTVKSVHFVHFVIRTNHQGRMPTQYLVAKWLVNPPLLKYAGTLLSRNRATPLAPCPEDREIVTNAAKQPDQRPGSNDVSMESKYLVEAYLAQSACRDRHKAEFGKKTFIYQSGFDLDTNAARPGLTTAENLEIILKWMSYKQRNIQIPKCSGFDLSISAWPVWFNVCVRPFLNKVISGFQALTETLLISWWVAIAGFESSQSRPGLKEGLKA
ncbi:hypothetical protein PoB_002656300 [Plakobranchus ocellatus]|uniref:Uncharacterized protein n=1 Tax=Plakobranchus ocellatus TaxID=259542 RepID=A0AAV4A062_9GAST|nr:hypothetical protein PoB_002656300 [Plakobranchus ocellatus]